ncbi:MAG TPA: hypothetical protein VFQ39_01330 [Longimicrobium sp.]|nr:hypothetical protein [Longimicrobium sp.]
MARGRNHDLPDGIIKLPVEEEKGAGCGFRGCLYGLVAVCVLLLAVMIFFALFRAWPTPAVGGGGMP